MTIKLKHSPEAYEAAARKTALAVNVSDILEASAGAAEYFRMLQSEQQGCRGVARLIYEKTYRNTRVR